MECGYIQEDVSILGYVCLIHPLRWQESQSVRARLWHNTLRPWPAVEAELRGIREVAGSKAKAKVSCQSKWQNWEEESGCQKNRMEFWGKCPGVRLKAKLTGIPWLKGLDNWPNTSLVRKREICKRQSRGEGTHTRVALRSQFLMVLKNFVLSQKFM